jgi:cytochrome c oxidase cbb3-type subunit 4
MNSLLGTGIAGAVGTVLAMVAFLAVVAWSWSGRRKSAYDAAARLPLEDDFVRDTAAGDRR